MKTISHKKSNPTSLGDQLKNMELLENKKDKAAITKVYVCDKYKPEHPMDPSWVYVPIEEIRKRAKKSWRNPEEA